MTEEQEKLIQELNTNFNVLWEDFCKYFPEVRDLFKSKEVKKFGRNLAIHFKQLCETEDPIVSDCLLYRFISSRITSTDAQPFQLELKEIRNATKKSLQYASTHKNTSILNEIKKIIKEMCITIDLQPNPNPDYRSRFHELLVFNMLMECDNIKVTDIAYKLDNGKDCDFRCIHKEGAELLIEVVSIHNIDLDKQDDASSFSEFINKKIQRKYDDKTKGLNPLNNFHIFPILEYDERIGDFVPALNSKISSSPYTVIKSIEHEKMECILFPIEKLVKI